MKMRLMGSCALPLKSDPVNGQSARFSLPSVTLSIPAGAGDSLSGIAFVADGADTSGAIGPPSLQAASAMTSEASDATVTRDWEVIGSFGSMRSEMLKWSFDSPRAMSKECSNVYIRVMT